MVFDALDNAHRYLSLHPLLREAFDWLKRLDAERPAGRYPIVGEQLFAQLDDTSTEPRERRRFETHRRYWDLQVSLTGGEAIEWAPQGALPIVTDFQPGGDIAFHDAPAVSSASVLMVPGTFAIFAPGEAHRPLCARAVGARRVRKVIFKLEDGPNGR